MYNGKAAEPAPNVRATDGKRVPRPFRALCGHISVTAVLLATFSAVLPAQQEYERARREMLAEVEAMVADTRSYTGVDVLDETG